MYCQKPLKGRNYKDIRRRGTEQGGASNDLNTGEGRNNNTGGDSR